MSDIRMFRLITGEEVIGEFVETIDGLDVYINTIQLVIVSSRSDPSQQSYGFASFPAYAQPKSKESIKINPNQVVFYIDIDKQFLDQYNITFGNIVAPSPKIILGR